MSLLIQALSPQMQSCCSTCSAGSQILFCRGAVGLMFFLSSAPNFSLPFPITFQAFFGLLLFHFGKVYGFYKYKLILYALSLLWNFLFSLWGGDRIQSLCFSFPLGKLLIWRSSATSLEIEWKPSCPHEEFQKSSADVKLIFDLRCRHYLNRF